MWDELIQLLDQRGAAITARFHDSVWEGWLHRLLVAMAWAMRPHSLARVIEAVMAAGSRSVKLRIPTAVPPPEPLAATVRTAPAPPLEPEAAAPPPAPEAQAQRSLSGLGVGFMLASLAVVALIVAGFVAYRLGVGPATAPAVTTTAPAVTTTGPAVTTTVRPTNSTTGSTTGSPTTRPTATTRIEGSSGPGGTRPGGRVPPPLTLYSRGLSPFAWLLAGILVLVAATGLYELRLRRAAHSAGLSITPAGQLQRVRWRLIALGVQGEAEAPRFGPYERQPDLVPKQVRARLPGNRGGGVSLLVAPELQAVPWEAPILAALGDLKVPCWRAVMGSSRAFPGRRWLAFGRTRSSALSPPTWARPVEEALGDGRLVGSVESLKKRPAAGWDLLVMIGTPVETSAGLRLQVASAAQEASGRSVDVVEPDSLPYGSGLLVVMGEPTESLVRVDAEREPGRCECCEHRHLRSRATPTMRRACFLWVDWRVTPRAAAIAPAKRPTVPGGGRYQIAACSAGCETRCMTIFSGRDGTMLAYHQVGEGRPLICLPGGPMSASTYLGDLGGLSAHRSLVLLDLRGTGDSAVPADQASYRCDRLVDDVEALREHLGLDQIDLLGHSAGANLAVAYAARYPDRIDRLALITPSPRAVDLQITDTDRRLVAELRRTESWFPEAFTAFERIWAHTASSDDWKAITPFTYGRWDAAARAHAAAGNVQRNQDAAGIFGAEGAFDPAAVRTALAGLDAPVLVLTGGHDVSLPPRVAAKYAALFPRAELAIQPGGGHFPWLDDPEWFVHATTAFLDLSPQPPR